MTINPVKIGVIGGSGLYNIEGFKFIREVNINTPWGKPSSPIIISEDKNGHQIAFLARHGRSHTINPSEIPVRANIAALKSIGVEAIVAFSAVGSLREEIAPGDFVVPDQIIDRTKGLRENTFFESGVTAHAGMADPFNLEMSKVISNVANNLQLKLHLNKTLVCIEGPTFSTRAESNLYRQWACDIINMSVVPEAKLAREAEIAYQMICMATDYDCWRQSEESVTVQAVLAIMSDNAKKAKDLLHAVLPKLYSEIERQDSPILKQVEGCMKYSIVTSKQNINEQALIKAKYLFPNYFE